MLSVFDRTVSIYGAYSLYFIFTAVLISLEVLLPYSLAKYTIFYLNMILRFFPKSIRCYVFRASAYAKQKRYELAFRDLNRAIELGPKVAATYSSRAAVHSALQDYQQAL